tara:strand:+ start:1024 stop:1290 length:267 start_codon:yes stop_codon:yes gene_type:complete
MKQLEKEFKGVGEVKGYSFKQITNIEGVLYVYEVKGVETTHYEVFKHVENKRFNCISYPRSPAFGVWAWTCGDSDSVLNKTHSIINKQ